MCSSSSRLHLAQQHLSSKQLELPQERPTSSLRPGKNSSKAMLGSPLCQSRYVYSRWMISTCSAARLVCDPASLLVQVMVMADLEGLDLSNNAIEVGRGSNTGQAT
jgi:hypothetical protein